MPLIKTKISTKPKSLLKIQQQQKWSVEMVERIIRLQDQHGNAYLAKNTKEKIMSLIDRSHIEVIDKFSSYRKNGFNLLQFVRFFLNLIKHEHVENLYMTIGSFKKLLVGLIDLFKEISAFANQDRLTFTNITNFFCQVTYSFTYQRNLWRIDIPKTELMRKISLMSPIQSLAIKQKISLKALPLYLDQRIKICISQIRQNCKLINVSIIDLSFSKSKFSCDLKKVFTLDALSEHISIYDAHCNQTKNIYPSFSKIQKDIIVLNFDFSQKQYRLGAVVKNFSIVFWDHTNNFQYEKFLSTTSHCQYLQTYIKSLEYFNSWITSDKTGTLYFWDILNGIPSRKLKCKYYSSINNVVEIPSLNIVAIVQQNVNMNADQAQGMSSSGHHHKTHHKSKSKQNINNSFTSEQKNQHPGKKIMSSNHVCNIAFYNYFSGELLTEILNPDDRVPHTISYSNQFQIICSAGLEKKIKLFQIDSMYVDTNLKGELIGHQNFVTSFTLIRKTSLLLSCDDKGKIKLWDFKNFSCIQTLDFSNKSVISHLLDMVEIGKVGVLGSRIHYINFQDQYQLLNKIKNKEKLTIEWTDLDQRRQEIYIFTQKDLRVIDMLKGSVKYIYGCFNSADEDYTCFRYFQCLGQFAIGNDRGQISVYQVSTGCFLYKLANSHEGSVLGIQYDQINKLFLSYGSDSTILIHQESTKLTLRQIKGLFNGKYIYQLELSVYHNFISVASIQGQFNRKVFIWNYQLGRLVGEIKLQKDFQVSSMQFINGYSILVIGSTSGRLIFFKIVQTSILNQITIQQAYRTELKKKINKIICQTKFRGGKQYILEECHVCISFEDNSVKIFDFTNLFNIKLEPIAPCKDKINYHPYRETRQTFGQQIGRNKHFKLELQASERTFVSRKRQRQKTNDFTIDSPMKRKSVSENNEKANKVSSNVCLEQFFGPQQQVQKYFAQSKAIVSGFNNISTLKTMQLQKNYTLLTGNNCRLKMFDSNYQLICDLNINYPLPYMWKFKPKIGKSSKDKICFAMKVINSILKNYESDISATEYQNYKLKILFDTLIPQIETNSIQQANIAPSFLKYAGEGKSSKKHIKQNHDNFLMLTEPNIDRTKITTLKKIKENQSLQKANAKKKEESFQSIPLVQQEFTKGDLNYELAKQFNFYQVAGPTLKQLDHIKHIQQIHRQWKQKEQTQNSSKQQLLKSIQTRVKKNQQKEELMSILSPKKANKYPKNNNHFVAGAQTDFVSSISKKLTTTNTIKDEDLVNKSHVNKCSTSPLAKSLFSTAHDHVTKYNKIDYDSSPKSYMRRCRTIKSSQLKTKHVQSKTETFQEYYMRENRHNLTKTCEQKSRIKMFDSFQRNSSSTLFKTPYKSGKLVNKRFSTETQSKQNHTSFSKQNNLFSQASTSFDFKTKREGQSFKLAKKPLKTSDSNNFRAILKDLDKKVRQKKIERVKN